ncbi:MAG TPA: hypothetical protein VNT53_08635 [Pseudolysinimonas sp.]|nr:hypothetical protein [Pseudolysinimonas sp.]
MTHNAIRFAVVGLGLQGAGTAELAVNQGYELVGAVDIGDKVGKPISDFLNGHGPSTPVFGSLNELLAAGPLDAVLLAAAIEPTDIVEQAKQFLSRGINVVTLHQDLLGPDDSWTPELDKVAKEGGASFVSGGAQDVFWVQLPALVASAASNLKRIRVTSELSVEAISVNLAELVGYDQDAEQFAGTQGFMLHHPAVLGGALKEVARRIGATIVGDISKTYDSVVSDEVYHWESADRDILPGRATGVVELASFTTDKGITFEGVFKVSAIPVAAAHDELLVEGDETIGVRLDPFPGQSVTNVSILSRVPDMIAAEPGVHFVADLPLASYKFPLGK